MSPEIPQWDKDPECPKWFKVLGRNRWPLALSNAQFSERTAWTQLKIQELYAEIRRLRPLDERAKIWPALKTRGLLDLFQQDPFKHQVFAFRGEDGASPVLTPSAERFIPTYDTVELFQSRAHHYLNPSDLPAAGDEMEWLALMQHHGAPTRLLDWTLSPYVAAFFALNRIPDRREGPPVVWALDFYRLSHHVHRVLLEENEVYGGEPPYVQLRKNKLLSRLLPDRPVLIVSQPFKTNQRMTIQQGLFMYSDPAPVPFETSLRYALSKLPDVSWPTLHKLEIDPDSRIEILRELDRMNINSATLFPGLDGFCQYLRTYSLTSSYAYELWVKTIDIPSGLPKTHMEEDDLSK